MVADGFAADLLGHRLSESAQGYDRLARWYWLLEKPVFRNDLQHARTALLPELPPVHRMLILGDGDGRLLAEVLRAQRQVQVTSVEQSREMIRHQQERVSRLDATDRVCFVCADATRWDAGGETFDCVVAPFFLDCFTEAELHQHLPRWVSWVEPRGWFYHVDFVMPATGWRRVRAAFWSRVMHVFFAWQTGLSSKSLVAVEPFFGSDQWSVHQIKLLNFGFLQSRLYRRLTVEDIEEDTGGESSSEVDR